MNTVKVLKENKRLGSQVEKLKTVVESLLEEDSKKFSEAKKLSQEIAKITQKINRIYLILDPENEFGGIGQRSADYTLDILQVLVKALLHDNESFIREAKKLKKKLRNKKRRK